jgi:hypothetical protein
MRAFNDLTGKKFGDLRAIAYAGTDVHHRRRWRVECRQCGRTKIVLAANLLSGRSTSCGCVARYKARSRMRGLALAEKFSALRARGLTFEQAREALKI